MKIVGYLCFLLLSISCKQKTEFFPLKTEESFSNKKSYQHIVVAHSVKNLDSLAHTIKSYSKSNISLCDSDILIFFYKETWDTPRDFVSNDDDCNFGSEYIGCHTDDIISVLDSDWQQKNKWRFRVRENRDSDWIDYPFESDCKEEQKSNKVIVTYPTAEGVADLKYSDTIAIDYSKNKKLLNVLKLLPESTMRSWKWSKKNRIKTVEFIKKNNYLIDSTKMYNNIKYIKPNTLGIQVVDGFWTLSIYEFNENHSFVVTNDIVGDGNDIQTYVFINNTLTPTKMINSFDKFYSDLRLNNTTKCIEFIEDNPLSFNYDFSDKNIVTISSSLTASKGLENCLKGNSIKYRLNKEQKIFDIEEVYWKSENTE